MDKLPRIALTPGEPAGIGPDIALKLAQQPLEAMLVAFADPEVLSQRAKQLSLDIKIQVVEQISKHQPGILNVFPIAAKVPVTAGRLDPVNASYVIETLMQACQACIEKRFDALVTGPVHKSIINDAGIPFSGHTEFLAEQTNTPQVVMMLADATLRVALVTTHLPLSKVSSAITPKHLENVVRILQKDLQRRFNLARPRILVCGLNPHAGENGHLGREEIEIITPVLQQLREESFNLQGPVPADTAFTPAMLKNADVVLAMYHDQGLPVLKHHGFGEAINITLGLPIIRTSVDHGTALDLAGTGHAMPDSLLQAFKIACQLS
ncbi:MAG: 4-hydroxythreonine-4-phosphate dehydrogenase PdxA [Pseudomonadota bacterium]